MSNDTGDSLVVLDAGEAGEDLGKDRVFQLDGWRMSQRDSGPDRKRKARWATESGKSGRECMEELQENK